MSLDHHLYGMTSDYQWLPVRVNASGHVAMVDQPADAADVEPIVSPWYYAAPSGGITDTVSYVLVGLPHDGKRSYLTSLQAQNVSGTATEIVIRSGSTVIWRGNLQASMTAPRSFRFQKPLRGGVDEILSFACITTGTQTYVNAQGYQDATRSGAVVYDSYAAALLGNEPYGVTFDFRDLSVVVRDPTSANNYVGNVNDWLTYTSPSTKWIRGSNGLYSSGTTLRTEYNASGTALGVRIEPAATNLLLRSASQDNASWTKQQSTITTNAIASPTGSVDACKIVENTVNSTHTIVQTVSKAASPVTYTYSGFLKAGERNWVQVTVYDNTSAGNRQWVNLTTGALGTAAVIGAGFTSVSSTCTAPDASGWCKFEMTFTSSSVAVVLCYLYLCSGDGGVTATYTGDGASGVYVWNMQLETGSFATSPIVTTSATVTRAADNVTKLITAMPFSATVGTLFAEFSTASPDLLSGVTYGVSLNNATTTNVVGLFRYQSNIGGFITAAGVQQSDMQRLGVITGANEMHRAAIAWASNDARVSVDGTLVTADATVNLPSLTRLEFGRVGAQNGGHMKRLLYVPRRVSNGDLPTFGGTT